MNIDKAIEILSESANRGMTTFNQDYKDAQRLGFEALKGIKKIRKTFRPYVEALLPGEDE